VKLSVGGLSWLSQVVGLPDGGSFIVGSAKTGQVSIGTP